MHSWKFPEHEKALGRLCRKMGFGQVSVSHEVSPLIKLVGRGDTTVVDAYLSPILRGHVDRIAATLGPVRLRSTFPFGLFVRTREILLPAEILVYPRPSPGVAAAVAGVGHRRSGGDRLLRRPDRSPPDPGIGVDQGEHGAATHR